MPPGKRRPKDDESDVTTDAVSGILPVSVPKVRHTDSELSSVDHGDRFITDLSQVLHRLDVLLLRLLRALRMIVWWLIRRAILLLVLLAV